jgi:uncharacterized protein (TIGR04255 family)
MLRNQDLPNFVAPPVVETVLGVEFAPLTGWDVRHFGLLWAKLRDDYPTFQIQPPLAPTEQPGPQAELAKNLIVSVLGIAGPAIRAWYIDGSETRLLQVQEDRFLHNWRKVLGTEKYPHYDENIRPAFEKEWIRLSDFLEESGIERPVVERWEVTYVNHLERGREWKTVADLPRLFPAWAGASLTGSLPSPESVRLHVVYPLPGEEGHLQVMVQPVTRFRDNNEVLQVNLTASGRARSTEVHEILQCFDLGREWVVRGFTDFTSAEMHELWGKRDRP